MSIKSIKFPTIPRLIQIMFLRVLLLIMSSGKSIFSEKMTKMYKKTKKCQPAARDTPNLIKIEGVPDSGLARTLKKSTERKIYKNKK